MTIIKLPDPFLVTYYVPSPKLMNEKFRKHFTPGEIDEMKFPAIVAMDDVPQYIPAKDYIDSLAKRLRLINETMYADIDGYGMRIKTMAGIVAVKLTFAEYLMLKQLETGNIYTIRELKDSIAPASHRAYRSEDYKGNSVVHVIIMRIRKKIGNAGGYSACVENVRGVGYRYIGGDNIELCTGKIP